MSENILLKAALWYCKNGYGIIPIDPDKKKPFVKWEQYEKEKAPEEQIRQWWQQWENANIGIITGKINNLTVIDIDWYKFDDKQKAKISELLPIVATPCAESPRGGEHRYFEYSEKIASRQVIEGLDCKSEGGYIIAPPSKNGNGSYKWKDRAKISDLQLRSLPAIYINNFISLRTVTTSSGQNTKNTSLSSINLNFQEGSRDQSLFHVAKCLVKGGMQSENAEYLLQLISDKICSPPFPQNEIKEKIKSALKRENTSERALADEVREWILSSSGDFLSSDVVKELGLSSTVVKKNLSKILNRLADQEGVIEKVGTKRGSWRKINREYKEQQWWNDEGHEMPLKFPLGVELFAKIYRGNVILLEGQKSQGKSAFALEFCRMNYHLFGEKVLYQNIEMSDSELQNRFQSYKDVMSLDQWRNAVTIIRQTGEWWDKIVPDGLNVVDYLLEYEKSYLIADYVWKIHQRLKNGVALVVVQRDPLKPYPTGGRGVRDIPRLILSLVHHKIKIEDVKSFHMTMGQNPSGLVRKYKQSSWWNFKPDSEWEFEKDEKYKDFKETK
jgi:hypothetical protein